MPHVEDLVPFGLLQNAVDNRREVLLGELIVAAVVRREDAVRDQRHRDLDLRQPTCRTHLNFQKSSWAGSRVTCFRDQVFPLLFPIHTS